MVVPDDRFVWEDNTMEHGQMQGDAREMMKGNVKAAGLARYVVRCRIGSSNVKFVPKEGTVKTWGISSQGGFDN